MFVAIADAVLKIPKSERHEDQKAVLKMMNDVFMAEKARWEDRIAEAQSVSDAADQERTVKVAAKDDEDAKVKAQKEVVQGLRDAHEKAEEVLKSCQEDLKSAESCESSVTKAQMAIVSERDEVLEVQKSFEVLKEGNCDNPKEVKMHLAAIKTLSIGLEVEDALVKTIPTVLSVKPSERGAFDEISLKQIDEQMENHLKGLAGKIDAAEGEVSEAHCAVVAWGAAVELAQEKVNECKAAEEAAEAEQCVLQAALVAARKVVRDQTAVCKKTVEALSKEQAGLQKVQKVLDSLVFLGEYEEPAPVPEDTVDTTMEVSVEEPTSKDIPTEKVVTDVPSPSHKTAAAELH
jgi:hypothetical protein